MANYTAADIKALREKTGAGMMDVKKALDESDGDQAKAMEALRVKGLKGATKREGRATSDGLVATSVDGGVGTMIELNSETDFVAKSEPFVKLADQVLELAVANKAESAEALLAAETDGKPVSQFITESGATLGEKVDLRRVGRIEGAKVESYLHRTNKDLPPQVGVLLAFEGDDETVAHDVAVHIAAMSPKYFSREDVPADIVENERRIAEDTAKTERLISSTSGTASITRSQPASSARSVVADRDAAIVVAASSSSRPRAAVWATTSRAPARPLAAMSSSRSRMTTGTCRPIASCAAICEAISPAPATPTLRSSRAPSTGVRPGFPRRSSSAEYREAEVASLLTRSLSASPSRASSSATVEPGSFCSRSRARAVAGAPWASSRAVQVRRVSAP